MLLIVNPTCVQTEPLAAIIRAKLDHDGLFIVSEGTYDPKLLLPRLCTALLALDPTAHARLTAPGSALMQIPADAAADADHHFWAEAGAEAIVSDLFMALRAAAPPGFCFTCEGAWNRVGFFRE